MILTPSAFKGYQKNFHSKIMQTPHVITLEVFSVPDKGDSNEFSLEEFVGDSVRNSVKYVFNALYEKDISARTREKYGITNLVNGIVYLSPLQVISKLGTYRVDKNKSVIHFNGAVQVIDKIDYLEELHNSCIAIQIFLRDATKGG